ncbi:nuclear transport factor 2 family protein [Maribacter sp. LLG6340-A2]|uniref:nuclear transport factor 2 family protein n=1 Tax=Maribacter sp. LLG6340-A2 TaxID=3160834 RepID=UPI00386602E6
MITNSFSKVIFLFTILLLPFQKTTAQVATSSTLYKTIKEMDSFLFENGFNECRISDMEPLISDDLEFYHDQSGITKSKKDFLLTIEQNICSNQQQKPIRKLMENSLEIFPLYNKGVLYGALQNGIHEFYIKEANKAP